MQGLTSTFGEGPKYSEREILRAPSSFSIRYNGELQHLGINGKTISAIPISLFGLTLEDFEHLPVNDYGFKTVAKYWVNELMVTALGYFVMYSHEIPSLKGLPSKVTAISGPIVTETGNVLVPKFSLFSQAEYNASAMLCLQSTFNIADSTTYLLATDLNPLVFSLEAQYKGIGYCNKFSSMYNSSEFTYLYPMVTGEDLERYNKLVDGSEEQVIEVGNNF